MQKGQQVKILIAEPWDFQSPMGANIITGYICDQTTSEYGEMYLLESDLCFEIDSKNVQYMVLTFRNKEVNHASFNIKYIPDDKIMQFHDIDFIKRYLELIMIGSLEE